MVLKTESYKKIVDLTTVSAKKMVFVETFNVMYYV